MKKKTVKKTKENKKIKIIIISTIILVPLIIGIGFLIYGSYLYKLDYTYSSVDTGNVFYCGTENNDDVYCDVKDKLFKHYKIADTVYYIIDDNNQVKIIYNPLEVKSTGYKFINASIAIGLLYLLVSNFIFFFKNRNKHITIAIIGITIVFILIAGANGVEFWINDGNDNTSQLLLGVYLLFMYFFIHLIKNRK